MANTRRRDLNILGKDALDLRTRKPSGAPWNFCLQPDQDEAEALVRTNKPTWLIGSPPCTAFCQFMAINFQKMTDEHVAEVHREGRRHLHFVIRLYRLQVEEGRHVLHEHPQGATSWQDPQMIALLRHARVNVAVGHQCQYGLQTPTKNGGYAPAKKATMFASTSQHMLRRLSRKCDGSHVHQQPTAGRAAAAAFYPEALVEQILRGIRDTTDAEHREVEGQEGALLVQAVQRSGKLEDTPADLDARPKAEDLKQKVENAKIRFHFQDGRSQLLKLQWKDVYKDEYASDPCHTITSATPWSTKWPSCATRFLRASPWRKFLKTRTVL